MSPTGTEKGLRRAPALVAALLLAVASPAGAVVGGSAEPHALARSGVMVLNSRGGVCSALVLAPDVVLTAGHCASGAQTHRVHFKDEAGAPVLVEPAAIVVHPGYSAGAEKTRRRSVDLALMRLPSPLPSRFGTATLASRTAAKGETVTVGGFGVAREGDGRSSGTFRTTGLTIVEPYGPGRILLWAAPTGGIAGACQGDSGGPITDDGGATLAVTSWARGTGGRGCGELTQGVLVAPQRGWIDATLSRWSRTAAWK